MRYLRALAAVAALVLLVAGIPLGLAATVGNPLNAWPDLLAGDLSDTVLIAVMAAVAYLAWAQFAVAVIAELAAMAAMPLPTRLPGVFGGQRRLAHALVAAAFLLGPLNPAGAAPTHQVPAPTATVVATAPVAFTSPHTVSPHTASPHTEGANADRPDLHRPHATTTPTTMYTIGRQGPGTYWDLAEHFLGDGTRWQEIWHLNDGRHQSDGTLMTSPGLLRPGWTVLLPASAITAQAHPGQAQDEQVTVHRGDTLSGIATDHGARNWQQLWEANRDRPEPGGAHLSDPDLILPGWTVTVPGHDQAATAPTTGHHEAAPPTPAPIASPSTSPSTASPTAAAPTSRASSATAAASSVPATAREHPRGEQAPAVPAQPAPVHPSLSRSVTSGSASTATTAPAAAESSAHPGPEVTAEESTAGMSLLAIGVFGAGGLLLAGVTAQALRRHRRRQFRHRRPGRAIPATPPQLSGTELALLCGAGAADVRWLNQALRGLVHLQAGEPGGRLPDVVAARLTARNLELVLTGPHDPAPGAWTVAQSGDRWQLERGAPTGFDPAAADRHLAPYPALVSVGYTTDGDYWLVDLERVGALALTGDKDRCLDLARFVAAELAHNTWSEQLRVTLTGFGGELVDLNPDRVEVVPDPATAVAAVASQLQSVSTALQSTGVDVLDGRLRDVAADLWFPHVLLLGDAAPASRLGPLLEAIQERRGRGAVAVVLAGDSQSSAASRWQMHLEADGRLRIPALGLDLIAQQLPAHEAEQLAQLLAVAARTDDRPMPDATGDSGWQAYADVAGAPRTDLLTPAEPGHDTGEAARTRHTGDSTPGPVRADRVLPLPPQAYLDAGATTDQDLQVLAPQISDEVRRQLTDADPALDDDLADWADPGCPRPKLTLLGAVSVSTTQGELPADRPRRAWNTEIVAYLACHPRGVSTEQFGSDLWPGDPEITSKSKLRQAVYIVRRWLGADPVTGIDYVPAAVNPTGGAGLYRVQGLLVDADLFRRLRLRGVSRGPDGITDLQAALDLVCGPPFDDRRPGGYGWLVDDPLDHAFTGMIVDVAHVMATHRLANGRPDLAAAAAQVALTAGSSDDVALLDLLAAFDAQGRRAEADRLITQILANHDAEVEEDLPPRTAQVLHRRRWLNQAS